MIRSLNLEGLQHFDDGRVDAAIAMHTARAIEDCEDRPFDGKARKVTMTLLLTPLTQQDGAITDVHAEVEVASSVPKHISRRVECRIKQGGNAIFNDMSPDEVDQKTIDEL